MENTTKIDALAMAAAGLHCEAKESARKDTKKNSSSASIADSSIDTMGSDGQRVRAKSHSRTPTFVEKLHAILSDRSVESIITWLPSGKAFAIHDKSEFVCEVLPRYMRETQFDSFTRRLKRWGFKKVTGTAHTVYCHDLFQKDRLDLLPRMNCRSERDKRSTKINRDDSVSPSKAEIEIVDQMSLKDSVHTMTNDPNKAQQQLAHDEVDTTQVTAQARGSFNLRSHEASAMANPLQFMAPPMMNYRSVAMAGHNNASMYPLGHMMYARPAPVANHAVQANNMNQMIAMNFPPQPHNITRHSFTMGMQIPPNNVNAMMETSAIDEEVAIPPPIDNVNNMNATRETSAIDAEIAACEEQIAILSRLAAVLRERRRQL